MNGLSVDRAILKQRFDELGWTEYRLAKEVSQVRADEFGENKKTPSSLVTSVAKVIEDPNTSQFKNVEAAIKAMGGELVIRWETEEIIKGQREVTL